MRTILLKPSIEEVLYSNPLLKSLQFAACCCAFPITSPCSQLKPFGHQFFWRTLPLRTAGNGSTTYGIGWGCWWQVVAKLEIHTTGSTNWVDPRKCGFSIVTRRCFMLGDLCMEKRWRVDTKSHTSHISCIPFLYILYFQKRWNYEPNSFKNYTSWICILFGREPWEPAHTKTSGWSCPWHESQLAVGRRGGDHWWCLEGWTIGGSTWGYGSPTCNHVRQELRVAHAICQVLSMEGHMVQNLVLVLLMYWLYGSSKLDRFNITP